MRTKKRYLMKIDLYRYFSQWGSIYGSESLKGLKSLVINGMTRQRQPLYRNNYFKVIIKNNYVDFRKCLTRATACCRPDNATNCRGYVVINLRSLLIDVWCSRRAFAMRATLIKKFASPRRDPLISLNSFNLSTT